MEVWIIATIKKMFVLVPMYSILWTGVCLALLAVFKFRNPDKTFPEMVAICYGGVAILIFWLIYVVKI